MSAFASVSGRRKWGSSGSCEHDRLCENTALGDRPWEGGAPSPHALRNPFRDADFTQSDERADEIHSRTLAATDPARRQIQLFRRPLVAGLRSLTLCCAPFLLAWASAAQPKFEFPPEGGAFKPEAGVELAVAHCLLCHSAEYVSTQPPLPKAFWQANVEKMQHRFGAPIPAKDVEPLVAYLTTNYGAKPAATTGMQSSPKAPSATKKKTR